MPALSEDTSLNFPDGGSGYGFDSDFVEFSGGAHLLAEKTGWHQVTTPVLDSTGWQIHSAVPSYTEGAGSYMRALASFDGGSTWNTYGASGWEEVSGGAAVETEGLALEELARVREWPETEELSFLIGLARDFIAGGTSNITLLTISYGGPVSPALSEEPDGSVVLEASEEDGPFLLPDFPVQLSGFQSAETSDFDSGHNQAHSLEHLPRYRGSLSWNNRTASQRDSILEFLAAHRTEAFIWGPPGFPAPEIGGTGLETFESYPEGEAELMSGGTGFGAPMKWIAGDPSVAQAGKGVWTISADVVQVRPARQEWAVLPMEESCGNEIYVDFEEGVDSFEQNTGITNGVLVQYDGCNYYLSWEVSENYTGLKGFDDFETGTLDGGTGFTGSWNII